MKSLEFFPYPLLAGLIALAILLNFMRRNHSRTYLIIFSLFWVYLLMVMAVTFFPIPLPGPGQSRVSVGYILSKINFIPFNFGQMWHNYRIVIFLEIFGNILMTIPYGFGLPLLTHIRPKQFIWAAMAIGFTIETSQLIESLIVRMSFRQVDINDFLLNTVGALIGYGLFQGFAWLYIAVYKNTKVKTKGMFAYLFKVADRQAWVHEKMS